MKRELFRLLFLVFLLSAFTAGAQDSPFDWLNGVRRVAGVPSVSSDELLGRAASAWAARLAASGVLSHRGDDGKSALDRYRALGGTEVRVGEILGAGPTLGDVEKAWMKSPEHRKLALGGAWTHVGWGSAAFGQEQVWVVQFTEKLVEDLTLEPVPEGMALRGRFVTASAEAGLLFAGLEALSPQAWDVKSRQFTFVIHGSPVAGYFRLGFLSASGAFTLTNAFTLPRGTGSPGAPDRSSAPAGSP